MANICDFEIKVIGKEENICAFYNALLGEGEFRIGGGCDTYLSLEIEQDDIGGTVSATISGFCNWSIKSALMREPQHSSCRAQEEMTLYEASKKWDLVMEIFSSETGFCFMEHFLIYKGTEYIADCIDYSEHYILEYDTKEEAEEELEFYLTSDEWDNRYKNDGYISRGGIEWEYSALYNILGA